MRAEVPEALYPQFFENNPAVQWMADPRDGTIVAANRAASAFYGYPPEAWPRLKLCDLDVRPADLVQAAVEQAFQAGHGRWQALHRLASGELRDVDVYASRGELGGRPVLFAIVHDISAGQRAERELRQRAVELAALHAMALAISRQAPHDLPGLLKAVVRRAVHLLAAGAGAVYLCDPERAEARCAASHNTLADLSGRIVPHGDGVTGRVAQTGEPLQIDDLQRWPYPAVPGELDPQARAVLSIPLSWQKRVIGVLHVMHLEPGGYFRDSDVELLTLFGSYVAIAIQNTRLLETERRRVEALTALHETGLELSEQLDLTRLLHLILERAVRLLSGTAGGLYLVRAGEDVLELKVIKDLPEHFAGVRLPVGEGVAGRVAQTGEALIVENYDQWPGRSPRFQPVSMQAVLGAPISWYGRVVGVMTIAADQFSAADVELVRLFADQAAVAITNTQLFQTVAEEKRHLELLYSLSRELAASLDLRQVASRALDLIISLLGASRGSVFVMEAGGQRLRLIALSNYGSQAETALQVRPLLGQGLVGRVAQDGQPLVVPDVKLNPDWVSVPGLDDWVRGALAVPLFAGSECVGVLTLLSDQPGFFTSQHLPILTAVAAPVAFALQNARLFEAERTARAQAEALREVAWTVNASLDQDYILPQILEQLARVVEYDSASVMLITGGRLTVVAHRGLRAASQENFQLLIEAVPHVQAIVQDHSPLIIPDVLEHPHWQVSPGSEYIRCWLGVPLVVHDQVIGLLNLDKQEPGYYTAQHVQLAVAFANQAAAAIRNAQLYADAQRRLLEQTLLYETSRELALAADLPTAIAAVSIRMVEHLQATALCYYSYDPASSTIRTDYEFWTPRATSRERRSVIGMVSPVDPVNDVRIWQALHARTPQILKRSDPGLTDLERSMLADYDGKTVIAIPMSVHDRVLGYFEIWNSQIERDYDEADLRLLLALAHQTAVALEKNRLLGETQRRDAILEALAYASEQLLVPGAMAEILPGVLARLGAAARVHYAHIYENWLAPGGALAFRRRAEWSAPGWPAFPETPAEDRRPYAAAGLGRWAEVLGSGQVLHGRRADLPEAEGLALAPYQIRSLMRVPIFSGGTWWGYLGLDDCEADRQWSDMEIEALTSAANALGAALARQGSEAAEREQRALAEALRDTAAALNGTLNFDNVLERVLTNVGRVVPHEAADIMMVEIGVARIVLSHSREDRSAPWLYDLRLPVATTASLRRMAETGRPVVISDTRAEPTWVDIAEDRWIRSYLGCPIRLKGQTLGFINLSSGTPGYFTEANAQHLQAFADQAAVAIENAQLYESIRQNVREIGALYRASAQLLDVGQAGTPAERLPDLARQIAEVVRKEFASVHCAVLLADEARTELRVAAESGHLPAHLRVPLDGPGLIVTAFNTRSAVYAPDVAADPRFLPGHTDTRSELVIPLRTRAEVIGVLDLQSAELDAFDERARRMLTAFAEHAALALENALLLAHLDSARRAAEEANQLKSEFLANTSHELRTPLTGILGALNILLEKLCDTPEEEHQFLEVAFGSARNLLNIVNDVLDIAKIEAGKMDVVLEPIPITPVLREVYALSRMQADQRRLALELDMPVAGLPMVVADMHKVRQILLNLLGNALKFTDEGQVSLRAWADDLARRMVIEVKDTGVGIPPEKQTKLFQPFVQVDGSMTRKYGGTGLGLSISRRLAEMMDGSLTLYSAGAGQGSTFTLMLPLAPPDQIDGVPGGLVRASQERRHDSHSGD